MNINDSQIRIEAFKWLERAVVSFGSEVLPRKYLETGFTFQGQRVSFVGPQGIWRPKVMPEIPLSITTTPDSPYDDSRAPNGLLQYKYRGTDINHRDNVGLRRAMETKTPLVYFWGVVKGKYLATWPVYIVNDNPSSLTFTVAVDENRNLLDFPGTMQNIQGLPEDNLTDIRRVYLTSQVKRRLHQSAFRERVLQAYREQCSFCRLKHQELLDAAHIIPDSDPNGKPEVPNGISLCKIHHAAFDRNIIGIRPNYIVEIRSDILKEVDGPMLKYGLQSLHGLKIILPRKAELKPGKIYLEQRYEEFRKAG